MMVYHAATVQQISDQAAATASAPHEVWQAALVFGFFGFGAAWLYKLMTMGGKEQRAGQIIADANRGIWYAIMSVACLFGMIVH